MKKLVTLEARHHTKGSVLFAWQPQGSVLATCGQNRVLNIFNRQGEAQVEIPLTSGNGKCLQMEWDKDGELLAVLQEGSSIIKLWDANQNLDTDLDTGMKDLTLISWSAVGPQLAIGNAKGDLVIYNKQQLKKQLIRGKHTKKITCGAWNSENKLALGSEDRQITISNPDGDTLHQNTLKQIPGDVQFAARRGGEAPAGDAKDTTMSVVLGGKSLLLYDVSALDRTPVELAFQPKYGNLVMYRWFGDGYIALGFESGYLVVMSSNQQQISEELFSQRLHEGRLSALALSPLLQRGATCSGNTIKVVDFADEYRELPEESVVLDYDQGQLEQMAWTVDGQILTVSSSSGCVYSFLACLPVLAEAHGTRYIYLTSLLELSVCSALPDGNLAPLAIRISMEPTFVALGPEHAALGMNNHVYFHSLTERGCPMVNEREYLGTVESVQLNRDYVAVLTEGRVHLQPLGGENMEAGSRIFPEDGEQDIACAALTKEFLIYATRRGTIVYFYLPDFVQISEFRHERAVLRLFPNELGTRLVFIDADAQAFVYNPVSEQTFAIPRREAQTSTVTVMWDTADWGVFVAVDAKSYHAFVHSPHSVKGGAVTLVGTTKRGSGSTPVLVHDGVVTAQSANGSICHTILSTHEAIAAVAAKKGGGVERLKQCFNQNLALLRMSRAWDVALLVDQRELYAKLGHQALQYLDVPLAVRVYRQLMDAGMVMTLQKLQSIEDSNLLAGHVALVFDDYPTAQELFLQSSRPVAALEMRRDLLQWEQALKLAKTLAPEQVPYLSREFAQQLEFKGEHEQALAMYQKGLQEGAQQQQGEHQAQQAHLCRVGIARMTLRQGDVQRGVQLALDTGEAQCCRDCASICDGLRQHQEAARLYEAGEQPDKAAAIYIRTKNWAAAAPLMARISSPKLHGEFAKAKEAEGKFEEAADAYGRANDVDAVVRLHLEKLQKPQRAFTLVRDSKSVLGALLVAQHCQGVGDHRAAIEFLILAKRSEEALELAVTHSCMEAYTQALGKEGLPEEYKKVAIYYEGQQDYQKAGEFWLVCKDYSKALRFFLQCGERAVDQAIEVVGRARSDMLTHTLIDFLMGETDGVPKDPNYIFRLYMALGNYPQAAKTAIIIARQEQELGNYRVAHQILLDTHRELSLQKIRVPQELAHSLMLLHSYVLVKVLVKLGDHLAGARMLVRVARNISKFPVHVVPILTSTVIECHRAGLRGLAFEHASTLVRPEYRSQLQEQYKRKIEAIVRKPGERNDAEEPETPSPYDPNAQLAETALECPSTRNTVPYCIATGRHIVLHDLCCCPSCNFPACFSYFTKLVEAEGTCPMCMDQVHVASITRMDEVDAKSWLQKHTAANKPEAAKK